MSSEHTLPSETNRPGRPRLEKRSTAIAARIVLRRKAIKLPVESVAERLGILPAKYRNWEDDFSAAAEAQYLEALARVLQVEKDWLTGDTPDSPVISKAAKPALSEMEKSSHATDILREALAVRAKQRREAMEIRCVDMARLIGVNGPAFRQWERCLPLKAKGGPESRWEDSLGVPRGWLRNSAIDAPSPESLLTKAPEASVQTPKELVIQANTVAGEIRTIGTWLCRAKLLYRTTDFDSLSVEERRLVDVFALRYGVGGEDEIILQVIGDRYGRTRERIRQIVDKMVDRSAKMMIKTPVLDQLSDAIRPFLPSPIGELDERFRDLLGENLSLESVARFAREVLGRNAITLTDKPGDMALGWSPVVIDPVNHDAELVRVARDVALRMIRTCGAAQLYFVTGAVSEALNRPVLPATVFQCCRMVPDFEWLLEKDGWFWFGEHMDNRLITVSKKILAAAGQRVDVEDIVAGFSRSRRGSHEERDRVRPYLIDPTPAVVVEVLRRVTGIFNIQYNDFYLENEVPMESVLSDAEMAISGLMHQHGNTASRHTLNGQLIESGQVKHMALQVCLNGSPIFRQIDRGVFALRGTTIDAEELLIAQKTVGGDVGRPAITTDNEGFVSIEVRLTDYIFRTRFLGLPVAFARLLPEGEYAVPGFEEPVDIVRLAGNNYRLRRFVAKAIALGVKVGDSFTLAANPELRVFKIVPKGAVAVPDNDVSIGEHPTTAFAMTDILAA